MSQHQTTPNLSRQDFFATTLAANVAAGDTSAQLTVAPTGTEGYLVIDPNNPATREIVYYNSKSSSTVTFPDATEGSGRGLGGTSVQSHVSGTLVEQRITAEEITELQNGNANLGLQNFVKSTGPTYVVSGLTLTTSANLTTTLASGVAYINGKRFAINSASVTVTASKDTYLDIKENGDGTTTVVQVAVSNGVTTGMTLTVNSDSTNALRVAKLVSSGTAITSVVQNGGNPLAAAANVGVQYANTDFLGNLVYPTSPTITPFFTTYTANGQSFTTSGTDLQNSTWTFIAQAGDMLVVDTACVALMNGAAPAIDFHTRLHLDGTAVLESFVTNGQNNEAKPPVIAGMIPLSAGSHTVKIQIFATVNAGTSNFNNIRYRIVR